MKLIIRTEDNNYNRALYRDDLGANNGFTRFDLERPVELGKGQVLILEVFNESDEPIGVYVKRPGATEIAPGASPGVIITGQVARQAQHEMRGYSLSGCVTRPE